MGLFRIQHTNFEETFDTDGFDTMHTDEWSSADRIKEPSWEQRYEYEALLINDLIKNNLHIKNVLELGSGPGVLSQKIQEAHPDLNYHLVDKLYAEKYFTEQNFKGTFFVKDLSNGFDTEGLLDHYDLVITNDFLEHVFNPSIIVQTIYNITSKDSIYFISNPNWRMSHQWVYRGLFDFDNFVYFLYTHKFKLEGYYGSLLKTPAYPKLDSESLLDNDRLTDWNHYMIFKHRK